MAIGHHLARSPVAIERDHRQAGSHGFQEHIAPSLIPGGQHKYVRSLGPSAGLKCDARHICTTREADPIPLGFQLRPVVPFTPNDQLPVWKLIGNLRESIKEQIKSFLVREPADSRNGIDFPSAICRPDRCSTGFGITHERARMAFGKKSIAPRVMVTSPNARGYSSRRNNRQKGAIGWTAGLLRSDTTTGTSRPVAAMSVMIFVRERKLNTTSGISFFINRRTARVL